MTGPTQPRTAVCRTGLGHAAGQLISGVLVAVGLALVGLNPQAGPPLTTVDTVQSLDVLLNEDGPGR